MKYYAAIDVGASSGRLILGWMENGKLCLEEVHRFENGNIKIGDELCWDTERLFAEMITGLKKCKEIGKIPTSVGIDTWGVDFVLLDKNDMVLGNAVGYRDHRTDGIDEEVFKIIPKDRLYERTGIQKAIFNTIYQLMAVKKKYPQYMEEAESLLFLPDYFHFLLTGKKANEYTEATTGQLVNPNTRDWDFELMDMLGIKKSIFGELIAPGTSLGNLRPEIAKEIGYDLEVIVPCTHDTAAAILAVPANDDDFVYISSGTWSLLGVEAKSANCSPESEKENLTNEGGYDYRICYLRNIMGLWMIQSVRHEQKDAYSFAEICAQAEDEKDFPSRVDVNDNCFLSPANMTDAINDYLKKSGQKLPENLGQLATVIYASLAECYAQTIEGLEKIAGRKYSRIHVIGGGSNAGYLNELTARATGKEVHAGPGEATAIGNIAAQLMKAGEFESVEAMRDMIHESFGIKVYK